MSHIPPTLSLLSALALAAASSAQQYQGGWDHAFDHDLAGFDPPPPPDAFNAIHLALIPTGPNRGKVLAMDQDVHEEKGESDEVWEQRWSIIDIPEGAPPTFENHVLKLPDDKGDLFCSGHAWMPDGKLFVAGGSTQYLPSFIGGKLCLTWDPLLAGNDAWVLQPELNELRWYPTVTLDGQDRMIVAGGTPTSGSHAHNSFEVLDPVAGAWNLLPGPPKAELFSIYPRQHVVSSGHVFVAGFGDLSARYTAAGTWTVGTTSSTTRLYGSSVILRLWQLPDIVAILGGKDDTGFLNTVEWSFPGTPAPSNWNFAPSMNHARQMQNAVVLPEGSILVIGGIDGDTESYVHVPELFKGNQWHDQPPHATPRDYHSTALLLPDGRVLSAAGDKRKVDYQVFRPHYLTSGKERPVIIDAPTDLEYLTASPVIRHVSIAPMATGNAATVVLLRPGSVTHHNDYDQRYLLLPSGNGSPTGIDFGAPFTSNDAPRGYYLLFVVSNEGIPSEAAWVHLQ